MKIYSIANRKGGVGKSTTAAALAAGLSLKKFRVLSVDLDTQRNLSRSLGVESGEAFSVLSKAMRLEEGIVATKYGDILPGGKDLARADRQITQKGAEYRLRDALADVKDKYDFCIVDCPPALGVLTVNALTASNGVVIPAQADIFSLEGVEDLREAMQSVKDYCNSSLTATGILLVRYSPRTILSQNAATLAEDMARKLDTEIFKTTIRESVTVKEAQISRQSLFEYAPKAKVTEDYISFINEFLKRTKGERQ